jgi:uncharacterized protein (DUF1684 family)
MSEQPSRLSGYRHRRDHFFGEHPHSPLTAEQRALFHGLDYFPEREDLAFVLTLDESGSDVGERIDIPTTDGKVKAFVRAGRVSIAVEGAEATLTVLRDVERGGLFIPFRDATAGAETYELGRYLEPKNRPDGTLDIDFNYAYNPFCAYGQGWSCPIPPEENRLSIAVPAGERIYRDPVATDDDEPTLAG